MDDFHVPRRNGGHIRELFHDAGLAQALQWLAPMMNNAAWIVHQRRTYAGRYRHFRAIHDFLRYDARYRLFLMEELFRAHDIPFERQRVFELGFGTGSLLLRFDTTSSLHGSEISSSAVESLTRDPRVASYVESNFRLAQVDGTPTFPGTDYDLVIASHVLEHVPDDRQALALLAQHTRPGGYGLFFLPLERTAPQPGPRTHVHRGWLLTPAPGHGFHAPARV